MRPRRLPPGRNGPTMLSAARVFAFVLALAAGSSKAHENPIPSATLVQRDGGHLTLTMQLDVSRALPRTLMPEAVPAEALALLATLEAEPFARAWAQATATWTSGCAVLLAGRAHPAARWAWPTAREAQALLQRHLMAHLTGAHADPERLSAQAEFRIGSDRITTIELTMPTPLRPLSVTTLRPRQHWAADDSAPISLGF